MEDRLEKTCVSCRHSQRSQTNQKYLVCQLSGRMCGEMRRGACGAEAKLWEAKDGEA